MGQRQAWVPDVPHRPAGHLHSRRSKFTAVQEVLVPSGVIVSEQTELEVPRHCGSMTWVTAGMGSPSAIYTACSCPRVQERSSSQDVSSPCDNESATLRALCPSSCGPSNSPPGRRPGKRAAQGAHRAWRPWLVWAPCRP